MTTRNPLPLLDFSSLGILNLKHVEFSFSDAYSEIWRSLNTLVLEKSTERPVYSNHIFAGVQNIDTDRSNHLIFDAFQSVLQAPVHYSLSISSCILLAGVQCLFTALCFWCKIDIQWKEHILNVHSEFWKMHASMLPQFLARYQTLP